MQVAEIMFIDEIDHKICKLQGQSDVIQGLIGLIYQSILPQFYNPQPTNRWGNHSRSNLMRLQPPPTSSTLKTHLAQIFDQLYNIGLLVKWNSGYLEYS